MGMTAMFQCVYCCHSEIWLDLPTFREVTVWIHGIMPGHSPTARERGYIHTSTCICTYIHTYLYTHTHML